MKTQDIQPFVERVPFRKFSVRLSNGARYAFETIKDVGATKDLSTLIYFGNEGGLVLIDTENIVEVIDEARAQ